MNFLKSYKYHNPVVPTITLYVNGLNIPIKRQRLSQWIKTIQDSTGVGCQTNIQCL